jgi:hypothetical protein
MGLVEAFYLMTINMDLVMGYQKARKRPLECRVLLRFLSLSCRSSFFSPSSQLLSHVIALVTVSVTNINTSLMKPRPLSDIVGYYSFHWPFAPLYSISQQ